MPKITLKCDYCQCLFLSPIEPPNKQFFSLCSKACFEKQLEKNKNIREAF
jgi:hypothetical protein